MNIKIVRKIDFIEICIMKPQSLLPLSFFGLLLISSCKSEYSERLYKAKELKLKLSKAIEEEKRIGVEFDDEIAQILEEIDFHAKVSGNEELFREELNH